MHLLIAAGIFPPDIGGPATYAERLASGLARKGHSVRVVCYSSTMDDEPRPYRVIRIKRRSLKGITFFNYLAQLLWHAVWADCVYAQGPVAGGFQSLIAHVLTRKLYFVNVTGVYAREQ